MIHNLETVSQFDLTIVMVMQFSFIVVFKGDA